MSKPIYSPEMVVKAVSDDVAQTVRKVSETEFDGWDCDLMNDFAITRYVWNKLVNGQADSLRLGQVVHELSKMGYTLKVVPKGAVGSTWK